MPTSGDANVQLTCDQLEVVNSKGERQAYRIFDHVTVRITVAESTAHGLGLRLDLIAKPACVIQATSQSSLKQMGDKDLKAHANEEIIDVSTTTSFLLS